MKKSWKSPDSFTPLTIRGKAVVMCISNGKRALVDVADWDKVKGYWWSSHGKYAYRNERARGHVFLHREIMNAPAGVEVDHINHKPLDCRRENLRLCTSTENGRNQRPYGRTSPYKGVYRLSPTRWRASIYYEGKNHHLGRFDSAEDAARAYDKLAALHFGPFAYLNFPRKNDGEQAA